MKITGFSLGRTLNVGDYESVRFEILAQIDINEDPDKAWKELQKIVDAQETKLRREYRGK